jgi:glycosyltransferase involved in cell wall biosynthesis
MRIGIDARELCGRPTGVGRYLAGLLAEWRRGGRARAHEFVLYATDAPSIELDTHRFVLRIVPGPGGTWWEQARAPRAAADDHLDVWFAPAYSAPLTLQVPLVLAVHDLSFFARPEWFSVREGVRRRWLTRQSVARAAAVITISQFSKRELMERLDVPAEKISVVPPGVAAGGWRLASGQPAAVTTPPTASPPIANPRVLFVGSLFTRRHVTDLVRAFAPIARAHADAHLDVVGDNRTYPREQLPATIAAEQLEPYVTWHEYVPDDLLAELYARARVFAFLSEYEGLGLTPLEALTAGHVPVLLDTDVARESCGDAAIYVPLGSLTTITRALEQALFDDEVRARVRSAAAGVLARYDWTRAADETLRVIERCCR